MSENVSETLVSTGWKMLYLNYESILHKSFFLIYHHLELFTLMNTSVNVKHRI
jgi:hypothetical protein